MCDHLQRMNDSLTEAYSNNLREKDRRISDLGIIKVYILGMMGGGHNVRSGCGLTMRGGFVINTKIVAFVLGLLMYRVIACFVSLIESFVF